MLKHIGKLESEITCGWLGRPQAIEAHEKIAVWFQGPQ
jgi:hypothetical protein